MPEVRHGRDGGGGGGGGTRGPRRRNSQTGRELSVELASPGLPDHPVNPPHPVHPALQPRLAAALAFFVALARVLVLALAVFLACLDGAWPGAEAGTTRTPRGSLLGGGARTPRCLFLVSKKKHSYIDAYKINKQTQK